MPQLICTTDEIGVRENRNILFLSFRGIPKSASLKNPPWEQSPERQVIIKWLDEQGINWEPCLHCSPGTVITPYRGSIYLDVSPEVESQQYQNLLTYLEDDKGQCRFAGVGFWLLPLEKSKEWHAQRWACERE